MKLATNGVDRARRRAPSAVPSCSTLPLDDHADAVGECRRILEVVRDEDRRQRELPQQLLELGPDVRAGMCIERGHRLVEQQHARSRASARARATRWRSPPESSPGRAFARCAMRKRSSSSAARSRPPKATFVRP